MFYYQLLANLQLIVNYRSDQITNVCEPITNDNNFFLSIN